jgi:hypothetical protein
MKLKKHIIHLLGSLAILTATGCGMTVQAVNPTPAVTVIGDASYAVDVGKVPDVIEFDFVTLTDVKSSVQAGFRNAVGDGFRTEEADINLVFDSFSVRIDEGQVGVLRVTYSARWIAPGGKVIARTAGSAIPINPLQTGAGHWRDALEVMFAQIASSLEKAQEKEQQRSVAKGA